MRLWPNHQPYRSEYREDAFNVSVQRFAIVGFLIRQQRICAVVVVQQLQAHPAFAACHHVMRVIFFCRDFIGAENTMQSGNLHRDDIIVGCDANGDYHARFHHCAFSFGTRIEKQNHRLRRRKRGRCFDDG